MASPHPRRPRPSTMRPPGWPTRDSADHALVAMAKWFSAAKVADGLRGRGVPAHGGYGYIDEYKVQRLYRDAKILEILRGHQGNREDDCGPSQF